MNSIVSIKTVKAVYRPDRPYANPNDEEIRGSGFIIDINKGLLTTNCHIVENAISITGRLFKTGKRDLTLELVGICREKKLALCRITQSDLSMIVERISKEEISNMNLKFGDSLKVNIGDSVTSYGYSSNSIKSNKGVVSGFEIVRNNCFNEIEDSYLRSPSYIQTNLLLNSENSGGPLLNSKGQVIGIITSENIQNVSYAIPSRTFLAIYKDLLTNSVVKMPTLALEWSKTNRELMKKQTGSSSTYGFYVRKVLPDSCLDSLEKGDIIRRMDYIDIFWGEDENSIDISNMKEKKTLVTVLFDRFGMTTTIGKLKNPDEIDEKKLAIEKIFTTHKMELSQVMDIVPNGTDITVNLCRDQNWYKLTSQYVFNESERISKGIFHDYEIFAGLCVTNLDMSLVEIFENSCYLQDTKNRYKKNVVISQVFEGSYASKTQVLKPGHLIKSIVGYKMGFEIIKETNRLISDINDVREILKLKPDIIQITTTDDSTFIVGISSIIEEDRNILSSYNIDHKYILD